MFLNAKWSVRVLQNRGLLWVLVPCRQLLPFSCRYALSVFWSPPTLKCVNLASASLPSEPTCMSYAFHSPTPSKSPENWDGTFKKIQIIVGLASSTSSISVDLLLASVMRLGGGCQTLNVTEMKFSWWGWSQAYYCSDCEASWLSSLVSMPLFEHKKHRLLCKIYLN